MKTIIAGDRDFYDYQTLRTEVYRVMQTKYKITEIVCGKARGADTMGEFFGEEMGIPVKEFPAKWDKYGKGAGPIRNKEMADYADALIAFLGPNSIGTANMIKQARAQGLNVTVIDVSV